MFLSHREPNTSVYFSTQVLQGFESCCKLLSSRTFLQNWKFGVNIAFFFFLIRHKSDSESVICSLLYQISLCLREVEKLWSQGLTILIFILVCIYTLIVFFFNGRECTREYDGLCVTPFVKIQTCFRGIFYSKKEIWCLNFTIIRKEFLRYFLARIFYRESFFPIII